MAERSPIITYGLERKTFDAAGLLDVKPEAVVMVPPPEAGLTQYLNLEFLNPYTAQSLTIVLELWNTEIPLRWRSPPTAGITKQCARFPPAGRCHR